ncbi:MAG: lysophospholipase [Caulobacterales bacterium 68-7]|nr:alpha/beta hydrolase [Caulobacterales bacterium]OJU12860.1 MAG: lysophospholipase [Caulobacterales bacterium 68-7]
MHRRALIAALLLAVAACGPRDGREAFTDSRVPPSVAPRFYPPEGWAWGLVKVGSAPAQRYGVAAPPVAPKANLLILTGYDDPAETWFETVADLTRRGYAVWVLDRAGQGGSARLTGRRDLGHAKRFDPDVAAVRAMVRVVIRPNGKTPTILVGHSLGGLIALRAVQSGLGADGLVLSAPAIELANLPQPRGQVAAWTRWARRLGLGAFRTPGQPGWRPEGRDGPFGQLTHDPTRAAMHRAWAEANPDLRMGGSSLAWFAAFYDASDAAQAAAARTAPPTLLLTASDDSLADNAASQRLCTTLPACSETAIANAWHDLPREADPARDAWLSALDGFVRQRTAAAAR